MQREKEKKKKKVLNWSFPPPLMPFFRSDTFDSLRETDVNFLSKKI